VAVDFAQAQPPASPEQLAELEAALGAQLPEDFKQLLLERNGGWLNTNFLPSGNASLRCVYSAGPNEDEHLDDLHRAFHRLYLPYVDVEYRLRTGMLPVGEDEGGNLICLRVAGEAAGSVWFWEHDAALDEDPFQRLADSWSEFFEALRPIEEMDLG
jgi:cell wall assembly regulator SMI1